jgi:hypothetical protein
MSEFICLYVFCLYQFVCLNLLISIVFFSLSLSSPVCLDGCLLLSLPVFVGLYVLIYVFVGVFSLSRSLCLCVWASFRLSQCLLLSVCMSEFMCLYVFLSLSLSKALCLGGCLLAPVSVFVGLHV